VGAGTTGDVAAGGAGATTTAAPDGVEHPLSTVNVVNPVSSAKVRASRR
jgi:hypothetical protein